jgi:uncharacterized membrane protein YtjA (UPF0391 family)
LVGRFDRSYPAAQAARTSAPRADFVPKAPAFFAVSPSGTAGNLCSRAGLFLQPGRDRWSRRYRNQKFERSSAMLSWVVTFLVVALIAGILGFGGIAGVSIEIAKTIFFIAIVLFLISAVVGLARGRNGV